MSNGLAGGFDAVVLIRLEVVNCILGTLHQNGASRDASPTCPHWITVRIGDSNGSPAAATRGTVQVQISTPTITIPNGSSSEVILQCDLRALYKPDPGTFMLPEPIHGRLQATVSIERSPVVEKGKRLLEAKVTDDDSKIKFIPAHDNWTESQIARITQIVRRFLREELGPINHELPEDFGFFQFKHLNSGGVEAIALPKDLSGSASGSLDNVTEHFLGAADHFAVGISKEFLGPVLQQMVDSLKTVEFTIKTKARLVTLATYHVKMSTATVQWKPGAIVVTVKGNATTGAIGFPDYSLQIVQELSLVLDADGQLSLKEPLADPEISGLPSFAKETAIDKIKPVRDKALTKAQKAIQKALTGNVTFERGLQSFDASAKSKYTAVEIRADGLVLRGTLTVKQRPPQPAVVHFAKTSDETALTAFRSWIPAGTVTSHSWSWVVPPPVPAIIGGQETQVVENDRFVLPIPDSLPQTGQICLEIGGNRIGSTPGVLEQVSYGRVCGVSLPGWITTPPPEMNDDLVYVPIFGGDQPPDRTLDHSIVAHVDMRDAGDLPPGARTHSLIHFSEGASPTALEIVAEAMRRRKPNGAAISVMLVLPSGSLAATRDPISGRIHAFSREFSSPVAVTEDYEGGWTRALNVAARPSTYVISRHGRRLWHQPGPPDVVSLTAVLNKLSRAGEPRHSRLLRLAVQSGERAPDFLFEYDEGHRVTLHRLRGRPVLLNFWKSWSTPCLNELRYLQGVHDGTSGDGPLVLAIDDGEDSRSVARVRQELGLTFRLIPDPDRAIARRYRVNCWPSTVAVNEAGRIDWVHFGMTPAQADRTPPT